MNDNEKRLQWSASIIDAIPTIVLSITLLLIAIPLIVAFIEKSQTGVWPGWSGLGDYMSEPISVPIDPSGAEEFDVKFERSKTLWDWLDLMLIPAVISGGAIWIQRWVKKSSEERARKERELTREIEEIRFKENALQTYFDRMTSLLLENNLKSDPGEDERAIARARTLSLLQKLGTDGIRKAAVIHFLYETELITSESPIVRMDGADLSDVDLRGAYLESINLVDVSIERGKLQGANLSNSFLENAYLKEALLTGAVLDNSNLENAYFLDADVTGASLEGVNLKGTVIDEYQIKLARVQSDNE